VVRPARRVEKALLLALLVASAPLRARAAGTDNNSAAAQALFDEAKTQMAAGRYDRACPALEESEKLDPALGTVLNLADCYEKAGRTASAWSTFVEAAAKAQKSGHPDAERVAKERARTLERRLAKLTITVTAAEAEPELEVLRDGVSVGPAEFGLPIPVDPGAHTVSARAPGYKPWETRITVAGATSASAVVPELEKAPVVAAAPAPNQPAPAANAVDQSDASKSAANAASTRRTLGLVVGGVGVAAAAAGGVFALLTKSKDNAGDKLCHSGGSDTCANDAEKQEYEQTVSDAKRYRTFAYVGFGVGAAALVTGAVLFFTGSSSSENAALNVTPVLGQREAGLFASGRF
jgi:tetratricopeptide (TPR) repeat protein